MKKKTMRGTTLAASIAAALVIGALGAVWSPGPVHAQALDPESMACIDCHRTEASGGAVLPETVLHPGGFNHVVGVDYISVSARRGDLATASEMDPSLDLPDGRVTCTTCHVPYVNPDLHGELTAKRGEMTPNDQDPMLAADNRGSRLCLACHRK